jgi:DNA-binding NtrC family response regulator
MGQARPFRKATVLVVENDEEERFLVSMLFEESDLDVIACDNAETAAAIMAEKPGEIAMCSPTCALAARWTASTSRAP